MMSIVGGGYLFSSWAIDFYYLSCTKTQIILKKQREKKWPHHRAISQHSYPLTHQCCSNLFSFFTFVELGGLHVYNMQKRNETGVQPDPNPCQPAWVTTLGRMKYFECQTNSKNVTPSCRTNITSFILHTLTFQGSVAI